MKNQHRYYVEGASDGIYDVRDSESVIETERFGTRHLLVGSFATHAAAVKLARWANAGYALDEFGLKR